MQYFIIYNLQTYQLHQLGYDIVVLEHKANQKHNSYPIMHTDGSGGEFLAQCPQMEKLWKQYFQDHRNKYHLYAKFTCSKNSSNANFPT